MPTPAPETSVPSAWRWQLGRLVGRLALLGTGLLVLALLVPRVLAFVASPSFVPLILQMILLASYLLLFIGFQLAFIYVVLARTRVTWLVPGQISARLSSYQGNATTRREALRLVQLLQGIRDVRSGGNDLLRGLLLTGPASKEQLAFVQAVAGEAGVPLGTLSAASLNTSRLGLGRIKVARIYRRAHKLARIYGVCVLLVDDLDAVARTNSVRNDVLNELLLQIDPPFANRRGWLRRHTAALPPARVLTIATAPDVALLDPALFAVGRFDRQLTFALPDYDERLALLESYLQKISHDGLALPHLAAALAGCTPESIRRTINEAVLHARSAGRSTITAADIQCAATHLPAPPAAEHAADEHAADEHDAAPPPMTYAERRLLAYHEASHMYVQAQLAPAGNNPRPLTHHMTALDELLSDERPHTRADLITALRVALAGRAGEETLLGVQTTDAADDVRQATRLAALLVGAFAMDGTLAAHLPASNELPELPPAARHERIEALLSEHYQYVCQLLSLNRTAVMTLAEALVLGTELHEQHMSELLQRIASDYPCNTPVLPPASVLPPVPLVARRAVARSSEPVYVSDDAAPLLADATLPAGAADDTLPASS